LEIPLAKTTLADVFLLKHGGEMLNVAPRQSVCAFRGIHFLEKNPFLLGFEKHEWLIEQGSAFVTEQGRIHQYSHLPNMPPDTVFSVRFHQTLVRCMDEELPHVRFAEIQPHIGLRNDLRYLRWRWDRVVHRLITDELEFAIDEWVVDLVTAACRPPQRPAGPIFRDKQLAWYAERIDAAREQLQKRYAAQHSLLRLAREVGMSLFRFARIFHELTGCAPHQYLLRVRYEEALRRLRGGATVTDACFASGFSNVSHFARGFKKRFGCPPSSAARLSRPQLFARV
jgi:AraC-like DNA-binding protein